MKAVKLFFFLHVFLFFSLPPAFSADLTAIGANSTIGYKSSTQQWAQVEATQNDEISFQIDEESLDGDGTENFYSASFPSLPSIQKSSLLPSQTRFPWNPFQSYYSRLTNSPPSTGLI